MNESIVFIDTEVGREAIPFTKSAHCARDARIFIRPR